MNNSCRQHAWKKSSDLKRVLVLPILVIILLLGSTGVILVVLRMMHAPRPAPRPVFSPEEAIEVSKTTDSVRKALCIYEKYGNLGALTVDVEYWNSSFITHLRQQKYWKDTSLAKNLPEDHGVWRVHWHEKESDDGVSILQFIDEQTGDVFQEQYAWYG